LIKKLLNENSAVFFVITQYQRFILEHYY